MLDQELVLRRPLDRCRMLIGRGTLNDLLHGIRKRSGPSLVRLALYLT